MPFFSQTTVSTYGVAKNENDWKNINSNFKRIYRPDFELSRV